MGVLAAAVVLLAVRTQFYATMAVLLVAALLFCFDIGRLIARATRTADRLAEALGPDNIDVALPPDLERPVGRWRETRVAQQRDLDAARALLDTVNAALLVVDRDGRVSFMNRAARTWARPSSESGGLSPPSPPEKRFAAVCAVTPWRTSTIVVGGPPDGDQPRAGAWCAGLSTSATSDSSSGSGPGSDRVSGTAAAPASTVTPERVPSSASLASLSAAAFCARGTQV